MTEIEAYSKKNLNEEILSIQSFSCHGMIEAGCQVAVANVFDVSTQYYDFLKVEFYIRATA